MKVALEYSGHLRHITNSYQLIKDIFIANENIEFFTFIHTWDCSKDVDKEYMINIVKPHRYFIDTQKNFERHPYQLINYDMTHEEYKTNKYRLEFNEKNPHDIKEFYEKPSVDNNFVFNKDLEVVRFGNYSYSHYPFNTISLFYSIHQVSLLRKSYAQEFNINFDYIIRIRSDMIFTEKINLSNLDNTKITVFDAPPHNGPFGKYTIQDQFAIGIPNIMNIYSDLFIYLSCYYVIFKLDWISEILLGFHLMYNNISIKKIPRNFYLLRYATRNSFKRPIE